MSAVSRLSFSHASCFILICIYYCSISFPLPAHMVLLCATARPALISNDCASLSGPLSSGYSGCFLFSVSLCVYSCCSCSIRIFTVNVFWPHSVLEPAFWPLTLCFYLCWLLSCLSVCIRVLACQSSHIFYLHHAAKFFFCCFFHILFFIT